MSLYDNYKAIYEQAAIAINNRQFKLIYEKNGNIYGSISGIPVDTDHCFSALNKMPAVIDAHVVEESKAIAPAVEEVTSVVTEEAPVITHMDEQEAPRSKRTRKQKVVVENTAKVEE